MLVRRTLAWQLGLKRSSSRFSHYSFSTRKGLFSLPRRRLGTTVNTHALTFLAAAESWNRPPVKYIQDQSITPKLLSGFVVEAYPDSQLVDQFQLNVQRGHTGLQTNSKLTVVLAMNQKTTLNIAVERPKTHFAPL